MFNDKKISKFSYIGLMVERIKDAYNERDFVASLSKIKSFFVVLK